MKSPALIIPLVSTLSAAHLALAQPFQGTRQHDDQRRERPFAPLDEVRSINGRGNHADEPRRGAALTPLRRRTSVAYEDGYNAPSGEDRPSARRISNAVLAQDGDRPSSARISDMFWQWGQFLDHDITETPIHEPLESFPIAVPAGDIWFDPAGAGGQTIPLSRSFPVRVGGVREQINAITAWIDGSQIYGSDDERADALRANDGTGRMKVSDGDMLPFNTGGLPNAPSDALPTFFVAGDVRVNEQIGLIAMHTLFVREHNYWADRIAAEDRRWRRDLGAGGRPGAGRTDRGGRGGGRRLSGDDFRSGEESELTGDEIYELARAIVSAELQIITYRDWLPILLGSGAPGIDSVYRPELDASISNEFATAAFRIGHTMLSPDLLRLDDRGREIAAGHISLADAFFSPDEVLATGIDPLLRGLVTQTAQELDPYLIDEIRNLLFGPPGSGGLDLGSLNLQRGRDHGLPSYAQVRRDLGLGAPASIHDISSSSVITDQLARVARTPEQLDLWVGALAENRVPGALVGETFHEILHEQFEALRDGDRLWYSRQLPEDMIEMVEGQSLSDVIQRNSGLRREYRDDPFHAR